eukprot:TRINITY_DN461_c0_g1_i3.p1 TRINITY_DN461_c0_g1~~TRINITY_DN461_c0_g1_i3.p1  ORF type:complete len:164 (+),score=26.07 TRINITY_DN461_c0_g1_i3:178-669(+)
MLQDRRSDADSDNDSGNLGFYFHDHLQSANPLDSMLGDLQTPNTSSFAPAIASGPPYDLYSPAYPPQRETKIIVQRSISEPADHAFPGICTKTESKVEAPPMNGKRTSDDKTRAEKLAEKVGDPNIQKEMYLIVKPRLGLPGYPKQANNSKQARISKAMDKNM